MKRKKLDKLSAFYLIVAVFVAVLSAFSFTFAWYIKSTSEYLNVTFAPPIVLRIKNEASVIHSVSDDLNNLIPGSKFGINLGIEMDNNSSSAYVRAKMAIVFEDVYAEVFATSSGSIASNALFDCFTLIGGVGSTLCLVIAIIMFSDGRRRKKVAKASMFPMIFNINEIMIFGLPIIFNPVYIIPFVYYATDKQSSNEAR